MKCDDSFFGTESGRMDRLVARALDDSDAEEPVAATTSLDMVLEQPGSQIDRYKLLHILGEGGMGVVYLAEQTELVQRQVALKIIKPGMDSQRVLARFEAEKQALALMDHPHIARVYDAGLAPSGRPYFVMEHVQGIPITKHCDEHRLTIEERLRLFLHVCEAVQHAHQKGIIHRDLKPSNILVTVQDQEMIPKVIDFGVARAIGEPLTGQTTSTEQGQLIGTPEYMSPEQADIGNQDIDTRTDVYSLGVVLYELLAGVLPFDPETFRTGGIEHIRKVICEEEPKTPSTRLSGTSLEESAESAKRRQVEIGTLQRKLRGDLDWITLKAMEKDRTRRYATVDALATDIRNYLNHQPVSAAPPGTLYRARKFTRRHRQAMAAAGTAVLLLFVLFWAAWTHVQAKRERTHAQALEHEQILSRAREQYAKAEQTAALETIKPILDSRHVGPEAQLLLASILVEHRYYDEAASRLEKLLNGRPEIAGAAHALLARIVWESSSLGPQDLKKVDEHRQKAEELLPKTAEAYYLQAMTVLTIHEKLDLLAEALRLDSNHYESRRLRALIYDASRKYKRLDEDAFAMTLLRPHDPQGYSLCAAALEGLGDYEEALKYYDVATEKTARDDPRYVELNAGRCEVLMRMGQYERVIADAQECLKNAPNATILHAHVFCAMTALGRYEEANALYQRVTKANPRALYSLMDRSMKSVFDALNAGAVWHPPDRKPEGPAFFYMLEAEEMYRNLSARAHRLITNCFSPCWSPGGTKVAFALGLPGYSGVAVFDTATNQTDLLIAPGKDPSWSPDGRHIAFVRDCEALRLSEVTMGSTREHSPAYAMGEEVWVMNEDGKEPRRLARSANFPSWSTDPERVYYHSRADNTLCSISIEDPQAKPVPVLPCSSASAYPAVSPDGNYVASVDGSGSLAGGVVQLVDLATQSRVAEWPTPLGLWGGFWSPDGREFSFGGFRGIQVRVGLWIYDVAKREAVKVLNGQIASASWSLDRTKLLLRLGPPYWETWVANLDPAVSTAEALGPGQTLDEHCAECITTCTRELELGPPLLISHWTRTASALWIDHPEAPVYLRETDLALDRSDLDPYTCYRHAEHILTHPGLCARLLPLAWIMARSAVERQTSYAGELAPMFEHIGRHEHAARLRQMAAANILEGSCRYEKGSDTYMVVGSGADIAGMMDEFHFASKRFQGDGSITARIESIENVHEWTKAGVMIRESLDPGARFVAVYATPGRGVRYEVRPITNQNIISDSYVATSGEMTLRAPVWIKIERKGDQFGAFYSTDGVTWTPMVWSPQTVSMPESVYIGLAVTSHNNKKTAEARISHVTTAGAVSPSGPFTESQDIRPQLPPPPDAATSSRTSVANPPAPRP